MGHNARAVRGEVGQGRLADLCRLTGSCFCAACPLASGNGAGPCGP